ncbi:kinetochore Sim4 complex subunit FTA2-domain-containing protein [Stachybotrys elegans]|uniref:Kinetochore Sim4 complex subunit FTA2-domain-containing protein n=1 Tax=Stachybotrys elegans TaxID=80388 RepID=A0A8K0SFY6_9HYPO|nr:kinetochore Sim4 complex subunit FTA2-domain-containing protein [Stachybotrys elegans]
MVRTRSRATVKSTPLASAKSSTQGITNISLPIKKSGKRNAKKSKSVPGRPQRSTSGKQKTGFEATPSRTELPPCPGPKLGMFTHHNSKIEWLDRLDFDRGDDPGIQGYVFRVKIRGQLYALKIFRDYDIMSKSYWWGAYLGFNHDPTIAAYYMDPFFCECRSYGRIREALADKRLKSNPAVPCYGYLLLSEEDEQYLESQGVDLAASTSDSEDEPEVMQRRPIRALVKALASPKSGVTVRRQGKIYANILELNAIGIYNRDIRAGNYRDGLLVDFGSAMVDPDIILDKLYQDDKENVYTQDESMFKTMLEDEKIRMKINPVAVKEHTALRSQRQRSKQAITIVST